MRPVRPEFVPESGRSRAEMEELQREVAAAAVFEDRLGFDPTEVAIDETIDLDALPSVGAGLRADDEEAAESDGDGEETVQTSLDSGVEADTTPGVETGASGEAEVSPPAESGESAADAPLVAGVDQAFLDDRAVSAIVVTRGGEVVERAHAVTELTIPYIPGLLSFREGESILAAFERLRCEPDLALFDGSGRIHFRQAGLATHMGVVLDLPSVGVAKSLLCGRPRESVDGRPQGWKTPVEADEKVDAPPGTVIGYAYQSRQYDSRPIVNPLYVSPGHRLSAETAVDLVARLCAGYKLPEPTRLADAYADEVKRAVE